MHPNDGCVVSNFIMQRDSDIGLAKERLNWVPKVALGQGLVRTIYFEDFLQ
jgi:hypothetical protein